MKKVKRIGIVLLIVSGMITMQQAFAESDGDETGSGFHGSIMVGGAVVTGNPGNLAVFDDNKKINRLDKNADSITEGQFVPMGNLSYTFGKSGTTLSLASDLESQGVTLSVTQSLPSRGSITMGIGYGRDEFWKDPYMTGTKRSATDVENYKGILSYEADETTGFRVSGSYIRQAVDIDRIGERFSALKRDGDIWTGEIGYAVCLGKAGTLTPGLAYSRQAMEGRSESANGYSSQIKHSLTIHRFSFETTAGIGFMEYDHPHPVFNRTRKESQANFTTIITCGELFGNPHLSLQAIISHQSIDANINFFDTDVSIVGLGLRYDF